MTAPNHAEMRARYTAEPIPNCCVCGSALTIARAGGNAATEGNYIFDSPIIPG